MANSTNNPSTLASPQASTQASEENAKAESSVGSNTSSSTPESVIDEGSQDKGAVEMDTTGEEEPGTTTEPIAESYEGLHRGYREEIPDGYI